MQALSRVSLLATQRAVVGFVVQAFTVLCVLCLAHAPQASAEPAVATTTRPSIGTVVISSGLVEADGTDGTRVLRKGDAVFEGDVLRTDPGGRTQINFSDGARLAVRPATKLAIEAYHDVGPARPQQIAFRLERGGFRTATGRIGRANRSAYRFATPQAVIGIRGTEWAAQIVEDKEGGDEPELQIGVIDGGITVSNDGGSIDLGDGADFSFATVNDPNTSPSGSTAAPAALVEVLQSTMAPAEEGAEAGTGSTDAAPAEDGEESESEEEAADADSAEEDSATASSDTTEDGNESDTVEIGANTAEAGDDVVFEYGDRCF